MKFKHVIHLLVAKNKSIFDDKPEEFEQLSNLLKRDLSILNRRIQELKTAQSPQQQQQQQQISNKTILENQKNVILILQNWTAQVFKSFENILEIRSQVKITKFLFQKHFNLIILELEK